MYLCIICKYWCYLQREREREREGEMASFLLVLVF